jgi:hypothetical protein
MKSGSTLTGLLRSSQRIVTRAFRTAFVVLGVSLLIQATQLLIPSLREFLYLSLVTVLLNFWLVGLLLQLRGLVTQNESRGSES